MATYEVKDEQTGKTVTFDWHDANPPNESDMVAVFAEANRMGKSQKQAIPEREEMPWYQNLAVGVGKGMTDIGTGALQRVLEGGEAIRNTLGMESNQPNIDRLSGITAENRRAFAPLAESSTAANVGELIGQAAPAALIPGGIAGGALRRAGTSALAGAGAGLIQPTVEGESPLQNAAIGGVAGAGGSALLSGAGKGFNALAGRLPPNMIQALAERYGIRTTLGEATRNPITEMAESWLEKVPVLGLRGFREKQQEEANTAAKTMLSKYMIDPAAPDIMKANRAYSSSLYNKLNTEIAGIADQSILPGETRQAAIDLIERYPDLFKKFQDTKREKIIQNVIGDSGGPLTFKDAWTLRDGLGSMIGQAKKKLNSGDVDKTQLAELSRLYGAINNDIDTWAGSIGRSDVRTMINEANDAYKNYVVKYDILNRAYDKATSLTGEKERFSPQKFSTALYKTIDMDKAYGRFAPQEIEEMTGLANIMQTVRRAGQYMENPPTGNRWGPLTIGGGVGTVGALAGGVGGAINTGLTAGGVVGMTRFLTGTEPGKRLAMAASKIEPDNPNMKVIMKMVYNNAPKWAALKATDNYDLPPEKLDAELAKEFLKKAGGDRAKAREMARAEGYSF